MIKPVKLLPFLLVLLSSRASSPQAENPGPTANSAIVYFYRTHYAPGGAVAFDIQDNGLDIEALPEGTYFSPGHPATRAFRFVGVVTR